MLPAAAPELDPASYLEDLEGLDIEEFQKLELLAVLGSIARMMVELGFSTDLRAIVCEHLFEGFNDVSGAVEGDVQSSSHAQTGGAIGDIGKEGSS